MSKNELICEKAVLIKSMKVLENCVDEGNTKLENHNKNKIISCNKLIASQTKISLGSKRKAELSAEIETIDKKIKEMRDWASSSIYKENSSIFFFSNFSSKILMLFVFY